MITIIPSYNIYDIQNDKIITNKINQIVYNNTDLSSDKKSLYSRTINLDNASNTDSNILIEPEVNYRLGDYSFNYVPIKINIETNEYLNTLISDGDMTMPKNDNTNEHLAINLFYSTYSENEPDIIHEIDNFVYLNPIEYDYSTFFTFKRAVEKLLPPTGLVNYKNFYGVQKSFSSHNIELYLYVCKRIDLFPSSGGTPTFTEHIKELTIDFACPYIKHQKEQIEDMLHQYSLVFAHSLQNNELCVSLLDNKPIQEELSNYILQQYKNGKETAVIDCTIADYYDEQGNLVISPNTGDLPMIFNIGDIVIPYTVNQFGEVPLSVKLIDGQETPKKFVVIGSKIISDGATIQQLTLQEFIEN